MMNLKLIPIFAILLLIVIPLDNVFGTLGSEFNVSQDGKTSSGFGFNNNEDYPTGTVVTTTGLKTAYNTFDVLFGDNSELIFRNIVAETVGSEIVVDVTVGNIGYSFNDIAIFASGTTIDIVAFKHTGSTAGDLIHYRSTDDGATWSSGNVAVSGLQFATPKWFDVQGNTIGMFYREQISGEVKYIQSTNGGTSFDTPIVIDDDTQTSVPSEFQDGLVMELDGSFVYLIYDATDSVNADSDIFYSRSTDSGASFSTPIIISDTGNSGNRGIVYHIMVDGTDVTFFFDSQESITGDTFSQVRSNDSGASFTAQEDAFDDSICSWREPSVDSVHIAQTGSTIYAMCIGQGNVDVFVAKSTDMGENWGSLSSITTDPNRITDADMILEASGNLVLAVWESNDDQAPFDQHMAFSVSTDGATTWRTVDLLRENIGGNMPTISTDGSQMWLSFDSNNPTDDIVMYYEQYDQIPVITLIGSSPVSLNVGNTYTEFGATCIDPEEGVKSVTIGGDVVDMDTVGVYFVTYDCQDSVGGNAVQVIREVQVQALAGVELTLVDLLCPDEIALGISEFIDLLELCPIIGADPPLITLIGDAIIEITTGGTYTELGATAFDNGDGDVTGDIVIGGDTVNTAVTGAYFVTYDVSDSLGNEAVTKIRTVIVATTTGTTGGGGSGSGGGSSVTTTPEIDIEDLDSNQIQDLLDMLAPALEISIIQEIIQTFFEFQVIDKEHDGLLLQSFLPSEQLGIRWSTGDDIVITSIVPATSPFTFTFEQVPVIKRGSGSAISENGISYTLLVPSEQCGEVFSFDCVDTIRYSVPVTVFALFNATEVNAVGTILVDLTQEEINPILVILFFTIGIPIVAGIIWKLKGGKNPSKVSDLLKNP